jgi:hypothetical protein
MGVLQEEALPITLGYRRRRSPIIDREAKGRAASVLAGELSIT